MPRQSRSRPTARPAAKPTPAPQPQSRGTHTAAAPASASLVPAAQAPAPAAASSGQRQPGLLAQTMSTATGAIAGSVIGHGVSRMIFGSGESQSVAAAAPAEIQQQQQQMPVQQDGQRACSVQADDYLTCLKANDPAACRYFLDQLNACHAAAAPY